MLINIEFDKWTQVKKSLKSDPERVLFDLSDFDRMLIVETVNTYEWNDCLEAIELNLDNLLGGCWTSYLNHNKHDELVNYHENKGKTNVS